MTRMTSSGSCVRLTMALEATVVIAIGVRYEFRCVGLEDPNFGLEIDSDYAHLEVNTNP